MICCRNEDVHSPATSGTFLVEDGPQYFCMLEILFGRLSSSLYNQVQHITSILNQYIPLFWVILFKIIRYASVLNRLLKKFRSFWKRIFYPELLLKSGCFVAHASIQILNWLLIMLLNLSYLLLYHLWKGFPSQVLGEAGITRVNLWIRFFSRNSFSHLLYVWHSSLC